jgi:iron complex transport system ATP-binding protein
MLELHDVAIARGGTTLLRGIDASFSPGTFTAIAGANGAGKSSLLAAACGALSPAAGRIVLDGKPLNAYAPRDRARTIALVEPTEAVLAATTVVDAVATARFPYHRWWEWQATPADDEAVDAALHATGLEGLRDRELRTLSAGERQRVWIALAVAQRARIVLLDEPTTHLDLRYAIETLSLLRELAAGGTTIVAVLHLLEEAAGFADRILILGEHHILAQGTPAETLTPDILARAYGITVEVELRNNRPHINRNPPRR